MNMPETEDSYSNRTLEEYLTLHCITCACHALQRCSMNPGSAGPEHQICGLSERESQHLYTLHLLSHCSPVMSCTACRKLWPVREKGTGDTNVLKWFILSNWTAQNLTLSHLMPHREALSHHAVGWQVLGSVGEKTHDAVWLAVRWGHVGANAWSCTYKLSRL